MTTPEQITQWANANYDSSHAAQCVVECWDAEDLAEYTSLADFLETAAAIDNHHADITSTAW